MSKYPIFLELTGKKVVVIGGGSVAAEKVKKLLTSGAELTILAANISPNLTEICKNTKSTLIENQYTKSHLTNAVLVIAATDDQPLNEQIYKDCRSLNILCNIVDNPKLCDFFVPAIAQKGDLQIAISTNGKCPAYAALIRKKIEQMCTEDHAKFLDELELIRQRLIETLPEIADRKNLLEQLVNDESFEFYKQNGSVASRDRAENIIKNFKN